MQMDPKWNFDERNIFRLIDKRRRRGVFVAGFLACQSVILYSALNIYNFSREWRAVIYLGAVFSLVAAIMNVLMIYLQTGFSKGRHIEESNDLLVEEIKRVKYLYKNLDSNYESRLKQNNDAIESLKTDIKDLQASKKEIIERQARAYYDIMQERVAEEKAGNIITEISNEIRKKLEEDVRAETVSKQFETTLDRLRTEIAALARRGNLNLVLGIGTTITGLGVLAYYVFRMPQISNDAWGFACQFFPRLTLVIFIEIFAYFFLKLYKASLTEIKYFQNEMTNVEARSAAIIAAMMSNYDDATKEGITSLVRTERNWILKKDETTVDLEREKIEKEKFSEIGKGIVELLKKK